ncbi:MAG: class I SAM-dependent RNA methyltransferase [Bryobacterales bacterium]|nr:class I SAM-dependent RNA methyltransferase [Bryobacterales bacterium]
MTQNDYTPAEAPRLDSDTVSTGRVEKLIFGGSGLIRLTGKTVMLPRVAPGEEVTYRIVKDHKQWAEGELVGILNPSPERTEPFCDVYGHCGGCHYQHLNTEFQRVEKVSILLETLERVGNVRPDVPVEVISGEAQGYRNRVQLHLSGGRIGYHAPASRSLTPIRNCPIASPTIDRAIQALEQMVREPRFPRFVETIELFSNERETLLNILETKGGHRRVAKWFIDWCAERIPGASNSSLVYHAAGLDFEVGHRSFFQTNRFLIDPLASRVLRHAAGDEALDLYCGVGLFSIPLALRGVRTTAVEYSNSAVRDLSRNAANYEASVEAVKASVDAYLASAAHIPNLVIADPPRAGLGKSVVRDLLRLHPQKIVLVSCDPATLARDLRELLAGSYEITALSLVDLFPNTAHIETVCDLSLAA